jgi:hypothetical protein
VEQTDKLDSPYPYAPPPPPPRPESDEKYVNKFVEITAVKLLLTTPMISNSKRKQLKQIFFELKAGRTL